MTRALHRFFKMESPAYATAPDPVLLTAVDRIPARLAAALDGKDRAGVLRLAKVLFSDSATVLNRSALNILLGGLRPAQHHRTPLIES